LQFFFSLLLYTTVWRNLLSPGRWCVELSSYSFYISTCKTNRTSSYSWHSSFWVASSSSSHGVTWFKLIAMCV
jgi:hypothetical protein